MGLAIGQIPMKFFDYEITSEDVNNRKACSICLTDFNSGEKVKIHSGGEAHPFHSTCIKTAVVYRKNCPNCRKSIDITSLMNLGERLKINLSTVDYCHHLKLIAQSFLLMVGIALPISASYKVNRYITNARPFEYLTLLGLLPMVILGLRVAKNTSTLPDFFSAFTGIAVGFHISVRLFV